MPKANEEYVFVLPCGCAIAMVMRRKPVMDEDSAWREVYGRSVEAHREAAVRGIRCVLVDHNTYIRDYSESMKTDCPHEAVSVDGA